MLSDLAIGYARDLSKGGIAFVTTAPVALEPKRLSLPQGEGISPLGLRVQVVRCVRIMDEFYDVAARFIGLDPDPSPYPLPLGGEREG